MTQFSAELNAASKETILRIVQSTTRMKRIIIEILAISMIYAENRFTKINSGTLFKEIAEAFKTEYPDMKSQVSRFPDIWVNET